MALLDASLFSSSSSSGDDVIVVENSLLVAENGTGTDSDFPDLSFGQVSVYVVHKGDTLSDLAQMFNVSVNTIVWNNNLSGKSLTPGQELIILPISGLKHIVKKGDTVESIAKEHKGDASEILGYNRLSKTDVLKIGDELIVPDGEVARHVAEGNQLPRLAALLSRIRLPDGYLMKPISKYVRTQGVHGYNGVDMAAPVGTPIYASHDGKVVISRNSGWNAGYGNYVVIEHEDNVQTLYAHMSYALAVQGAEVSKGDIIGYVGNTGKSTGPHLHFEVRGAYNPF